MKLLDEKLVEEAARKHCNIKQDLVIDAEERYYKDFKKYDGFKAGVSFAEQQLKDYEVLLNSYKKEILSGQLSIINYTTVLKNMAIVQRDYTLLFSQQQSLINAYNYWNW